MKRILCNKYEVLKPIAEGGMGAVFLVKDLHLNRLAAVKLSKAPEGERKAGAKETFTREMEMLRNLSHPALPGIIDFFEEGENLCLVMEYVEGITLEQYLRKFTRVEEKTAVRWAAALTEVMEYLHDRKPPVIYRDLKPANIMIQPDGSIKLVDLGAAHTLSYGIKEKAPLMGTPGYCPPELWEVGKMGKTWDIYGIGAVLHEMLTGIGPRQASVERRPIREYDRSLSPELESIIRCCTARKTKDRYQSMSQLREALLQYGRKDRKREKTICIKRAAGAGLWLLAFARLLLPFLWGVKAQNVPFPYLKQPLFLFGAALVWHFLFLRRPHIKRPACRQEKSLLLTEKKYAGLYAAFGFLLLFLLIKATARLLPLEAHASEEKGMLWVEMRDEQGRKLLLKEDAVCRTGEVFRFELPAKLLPEKQIALWLLAKGTEGELYSSRVFLLENG